MCVSEGWSDAMEMVRFQSASIKHDCASCTICTAFSGAAKHCSTNFVKQHLQFTTLLYDTETSPLEARVWKILQLLLSDVFALAKNASFHGKIITTKLGHFRSTRTERLLGERGSLSILFPILAWNLSSMVTIGSVRNQDSQPRKRELEGRM